jgi:hypothetical protein
LDHKHDGSKLIGRRHALRLFGVGLGAAGGLVVFGCKKGGEGGAGGGGGGGGAQSCAEQGNPDDQARQLRKNLQYKDKSDFPDKVCRVCAQYEDAKFSADCGGCKLFGGGVHPEGHCLSFAPKNAAPGGTPGAPGVTPTPGAQPPAPAGGTPAKAPG